MVDGFSDGHEDTMDGDQIDGFRLLVLYTLLPMENDKNAADKDQADG